MKQYPVIITGLIGCLLLAGCSALKNSPKYQLSDDVYTFHQKGTKPEKVWVYAENDSVKISAYNPPNLSIAVIPDRDQYFMKHSFDVDVMTVGFQYRPARSNLPAQLTTDFNGNVYLGYRLDRFTINYRKIPGKTTHTINHKAITAGIFGGLGSTSVTPWTTNNKITDEYNGFVLTRGVAVMFGINTLTVGIGAGWDYLTDRDKAIWIYQNKPWYGLAIGLNLN
jgi:hypothetical protein